MKLHKRLVSAVLSAAIMLSCVSFGTVSVSAAPSVSAGWNETLYAEWADSDPDAANVKVGYKLSTDSAYTYLEGNDLTYLVRKASTDGYGRVDIPGLKEGRYDIEITASDGTVHTRKGIQVYAYDRSGYAHWNYGSGVGAYNNDGTPKSNAIIVYITDENKNTVEIPGYEGHDPVPYASSTSGASWTRETAGVGNILNNNHKFIREVTGTDNHPIIFRIVGEVMPPENLTPYNTKTNELGGSKGDNGNLAITKYAKNITIEGIGADATINGWGFTFSQTSTCPADAGESFEVRNLTFKNYPEDALGFQGDDAITSPIRRVWVHNNVFYPGYCANPTESDKAEGDGSLDFKRGQYYTMSYNHYINCHKTNLLGAGDSNDQFYMTLHHNWYQDVESRQPLAAGGNVHIYNTYFSDSMTRNGRDHTTSKVIDLRGKAAAFTEENYFENTKNPYYSRKTTANIKTYNDMLVGSIQNGSITGTLTVAATRDQSGIPDNGLNFPNGDSLKDWDINPAHFYYDAATKTSDVEVLNDAKDVPEYVRTYAGTLKEFPLTESGSIVVTVKSGTTPLTDAAVTANGLKFKNNGDGTYTATAQLGSEYIISAAKDGYSTQTVTSEVLQNDGDVFNATLDLPVDYDGYAAVQLTGGTDNAAVTGVSIRLDNGIVLEEKGNGLYRSAEQIAVGQYTATITNTGDYKVPASVSITVKTTDEPTDVHLDKEQGNVSVKLSAAAGETEAMGTAKATVSVGTTALKNEGNGVFTGSVDVGTPYEIYVNVPGWDLVSLTPATITAAKGTTATAEATFSYKGQLFTWNYTEGTNTDDFFVFSSTSDWSSASKTPLEFEGESLTKAIKMQSSTTITFEAATDGTLTLVIQDAGKTDSTVKLGLAGETAVAYPVTTGTVTIPVKAGTNILTKGKNETHLYLLQYAGQNEPDPDIEDELEDEIMWDVSADLAEGSNGLTVGETFFTNSEEAGPREFVEGDKTYKLENWVQAKNDPKNSEGVSPQSAITTDRVPVTGAFIKFVPEKNGVFTVAAKTNAQKITYITDADGNALTTVGSAESDTSYDVIRAEVKAGKTYYLYSGGSKICVYYLGFSSDGTEPDPGETMLGDTDCNGVVEATDAAMVLQYVLNPAGVDISEQGMKNMRVTRNGVDASTASAILQKALVSTFVFEVEE